MLDGVCQNCTAAPTWGRLTCRCGHDKEGGGPRGGHGDAGVEEEVARELGQEIDGRAVGAAGNEGVEHEGDQARELLGRAHHPEHSQAEDNGAGDQQGHDQLGQVGEARGGG